jgi:hypothetical protein
MGSGKSKLVAKAFGQFVVDLVKPLASTALLDVFYFQLMPTKIIIEIYIPNLTVLVILFLLSRLLYRPIGSSQSCSQLDNLP